MKMATCLTGSEERGKSCSRKGQYRQVYKVIVNLCHGDVYNNSRSLNGKHGVKQTPLAVMHIDVYEKVYCGNKQLHSKQNLLNKEGALTHFLPISICDILIAQIHVDLHIHNNWRVSRMCRPTVL